MKFCGKISGEDSNNIPEEVSNIFGAGIMGKFIYFLKVGFYILKKLI